MYKIFYLRHVWLCVGLLCGAVAPFAQAQPILSSEDAVAMAIANNPLLQAARTAVAQAEGRRLQAGRLDNPELGLDYAGDQAFNDEGEQSFGVAFSQNFPVTKRLQIEQAVAQTEIAVARAEIDDAVRQLKQQVHLAILDLVTTQAELALREELKRLNREFLEFIESRIATGEASPVEVDQLRLALYVIEQEAHHLEHQVTAEQAALRKLLGVEPDYAFELSATLATSDDLHHLPSFDQAALEAHPAYRLRQLLLQLAEGRIANARAERWADVAIQVLYQENRGIDAPNGLGRDRFFGIGFSVPLPLHNRNQGNIAEQRAIRSEMQWRMQAAASKLRIEADLQRELVVDLHHQAVKYESEIEDLVERNVAAMKEGYANGQISLSDLFQTQTQSLSIQSTHIEVLSELAKARIQWSAATGIRL